MSHITHLTDARTVTGHILSGKAERAIASHQRGNMARRVPLDDSALDKLVEGTSHREVLLTPTSTHARWRMGLSSTVYRTSPTLTPSRSPSRSRSDIVPNKPRLSRRECSNFGSRSTPTQIPRLAHMRPTSTETGSILLHYYHIWTYNPRFYSLRRHEAYKRLRSREQKQDESAKIFFQNKAEVPMKRRRKKRLFGGQVVESTM